MAAIVWLVLLAGILPLAIGLWRLRHAGGSDIGLRMTIASALLCALAFNLTFFWQELWLVIPKALTPGLYPILYHNDHDWRGDAPIAELLQGCGAIATLVCGIACLGLRATLRHASATWRLLLFWMAFEGLYQALSQLAIGTLLPGNDVGRALAWLAIGGAGRGMLLAVAVAAMALTGLLLARLTPARAFVRATLLPALIALPLIVPFRLPRELVEVLLIPLVVHLIGLGWLTLGASLARAHDRIPSVTGPAIALMALLLVFQLVLRPGIAF
jgi:hypothetical protein